MWKMIVMCVMRRVRMTVALGLIIAIPLLVGAGIAYTLAPGVFQRSHWVLWPLLSAFTFLVSITFLVLIMALVSNLIDFAIFEPRREVRRLSQAVTELESTLATLESSRRATQIEMLQIISRVEGDLYGARNRGQAATRRVREWLTDWLIRREDPYLVNAFKTELRRRQSQSLVASEPAPAVTPAA